MIYLKLNSSQERECPCPKAAYFLFLGIDPRARFNQQFKHPTTVLPRYFQQQRLLNREVTSTIRDSARSTSFDHFDEISAF